MTVRAVVPPWLKQMLREAKQKSDQAAHDFTCEQLAKYQLNTVCDGARCPNRGSCFSQGTATFMILGSVCTRDCRFCAVSHGSPEPLNPAEPRRIKEAVKTMGLSYVVITSVTRDDLSDGGSGQFAAVVRELRTMETAPLVEVLTPDFQGSEEAVRTVLTAGPQVFAHNVEMVPRLYRLVRPGAEYDRSVAVLRQAAKWAGEGTVIKTGFMLGLGEECAEVLALLTDLRSAGVTMVTIGQYLAPTMEHYPVISYVPPDEFSYWEQQAYALGFTSVAAGPLVRSSYHAGEYFGMLKK